MARKVRHRRGRKEKEVSAPIHEETGWHSAWGKLSEWQQHLVCVLALVVVALGFSAPAVFGDKSLIGSDTVNWRAMAEAMLEYRQETGEQALWAPNAFAGMPGYMISYPDVVPQLDTIAAVLRKVMWPASHFLVLLLGMYLLVFYLTESKLGAVLSAGAFALTTYLPVLLVAGHNSKFITLAFTPWLVLAFAYALRRPRLLAGLLFAIALAVNLRAGHVQITYYITFLLGIWWIVEGVGAARIRRIKNFGLSTLWLAVGSVLGLLMVAQPYLANFEYKAYTIRGAAAGGEAGGLDWTYAMRWSQGAAEMVTLLIADAFGGSGATYWGPKPFTAGPHYVGGIVIVLALLAVARVRRNVVWSFGIGAFLMGLFSLGEHLPSLNRLMFEYFPLFQAFRVPETWLSPVAFALAVLAGFGLMYATRHWPTAGDDRPVSRSVYVALGSVTALVLVLMLFRGSIFDFERSGEYEMVVQQIAQSNNVSPSDPRVTQTARSYMTQVREEREEMFSSDAMRTLIFLVLAGLVLAGHRRRMIPSWAARAALALLVIVDLWGVGRRYFDEDHMVRAANAEEQIPTYAFDRFILERQEEVGGAGHFRVLSLEGGDPMANPRPSYHFESIGGYHGAKLRLFQDYIDHMFVDEGSGIPSREALSLLNTRYVIARGLLPGTEVVFSDEQTGLSVLENRDALPRAFFAGETEVVDSPEETWRRIQGGEVDLRRTVLLPEAIDFQPTPLGEESDVSIELVEYTPREVVWRVRTDAPRLFVASEIYYPAGWTADLDGVEVPIYRANYLLRAVPVQAGEHTLTMRFEPRSHQLGVLLAGASTAAVYGGVLLLLGLGWYRRRRE